MRRFCLILLLLIAAAAQGQIGLSTPSSTPGVRLRSRNISDLGATAKVLLSNYCRLDYEGARLQPEGWARFKNYTSLRNNPEFHQVVIVSRYDVEWSAEAPYSADVAYRVTGIFDENEGYSPLPTVARVTFRTQELNGDLVVAEIKPDVPHVSAQAAVTWMKLRLQDPKLPESVRSHLKSSLDEVSKLAPQPKAAPAQ